MVDRRTLQSCAFALVGILGAIPILFLPKLLFGLGPHPGNDPPFVLVSTACMTAGIAWGLYFSIKGFRRGDEFMQARSKFAWYWGSMIGICAMAPIFCFSMFGGLQWFVPSVARMGRDAWMTYAYGLMTPLVAQMAGFGLVTFWWRATKR